MTWIATMWDAQFLLHHPPGISCSLAGVWSPTGTTLSHTHDPMSRQFQSSIARGEQDETTWDARTRHFMSGIDCCIGVNSFWPSLPCVLTASLSSYVAPATRNGWA